MIGPRLLSALTCKLSAHDMIRESYESDRAHAGTWGSWGCQRYGGVEVESLNAFRGILVP